ncbi:hypothetical protein HPY28_01435 [Brevibacillus sp. HB1.2]|uniref:hypothetical protein n=1 Tax=Brevibacillus TaxID=55080 RepID=UPI0003647B69|nr:MULTISPECIES: hypothetical protein [unclassified Brevibacillus]ATF13290.1 hypothetical protein A616_15265 [Brevibacillus brevis X23]NTU18984.1 hypothetical protein [Brevibacillus sp. HB1.2]NTU29791.1 hypothetical protein [Brevibacillus sp. HB1.1]
MANRLLIAGGYGVIGSAIARLIRSINKNVEIVLAGRNPEKGAPLARELGHSQTAYLDLTSGQTIENLGELDLIVVALQDPGDVLLQAALTKGIAHIGITKLADELSTLTFAALQTPPKRPIVPLGHAQTGILTFVAAQAAMDFALVESIELASLHDERDLIGPSTLEESEGFISRALLRQDAQWKWVDATQHGRLVRLSGDYSVEGFPMAILDVPNLASITGAPNVRFDFVLGDSIGTRAGKSASQDLYIEMKGFLKTGKPASYRISISDPKGHAHMTALGVLLSIERILGWDGNPPADGGVYLPDTLLPIDTAIARIKDFGVQITTEMEGV